MRAMLFLAFVVAGCANNDVSRQVGARCDSVHDCDDRCLGPSGDFPGGFCSVDCTDDGDCPNDATCVDRDGGICLFGCNTDRDCEFLGAGWTCHEDESKARPDKVVKVCRG